ncbi:hypothetical protein TNCV_648721 [Trichonephila clavipes]|uniref:Uncharacterized protein n=1 Tax=Trichonephila clavipes TaxID=2585209 RepID=A0A8X6VNU5_TRICX|nr:hypothetical protein TNCV_648721 [Trichonephila clavipes]
MSATKVMLTIFWNASGVLYTEFLTKGLTVNSDSSDLAHNIEGDIERSTVFNGCRNSGSRAQMDMQPAGIFMHGRKEKMVRTIERMCSC